MLSRRNLEALIAKLDGYPLDSHCTIERDGIYVKAEPDEIHYADRIPGEMHTSTELRMRERSS